MPKPKSKILTLQQEYLRTRDPQIIGDLYKTLTTLGTRINERERLLEDEDGVLDLATDICMRLMEEGKPVIESAPSAYLKNALFYRSKPSAREEKQIPIEEGLGVPMMQRDEGLTDDEYAGILLSRFEGESEAARLAAKVIESRIPFRDIRRAIEDREFRSEFTARMKEIRNAIEEDM